MPTFWLQCCSLLQHCSCSPHSERASRRAPSNSIYPLCSKPEQRHEMSMQKIRHSNSLPIGIHPPWTTDESQGPRPAGEEVGSCVPNSLQLWPCIYKADEESPWDPHKGTQSCHQTGRDREVSHSRVRLATASPNTVGEDQHAGPSEQHHTAHQRDYTSGWLISSWSTHADEGVAIPECWQPVLDYATMMNSTHTTPRHTRKLWWNNRCYLACYVSVN